MNPLPEIDRRICVKCLCCHEMCPTGAMEVRKLYYEVAKNVALLTFLKQEKDGSLLTNVVLFYHIANAFNT